MDMLVQFLTILTGLYIVAFILGLFVVTGLFFWAFFRLFRGGK